MEDRFLPGALRYLGDRAASQYELLLGLKWPAPVGRDFRREELNDL